MDLNCIDLINWVNFELWGGEFLVFFWFLIMVEEGNKCLISMNNLDSEENGVAVDSVDVRFTDFCKVIDSSFLDF